MLNDKKILKKVLKSIDSMTTDEYKQIYDSIMDEENVQVVSNDFNISMTIGRVSYLEKLNLDYPSYPPIHIGSDNEHIFNVISPSRIAA